MGFVETDRKIMGLNEKYRKVVEFVFLIYGIIPVILLLFTYLPAGGLYSLKAGFDRSGFLLVNLLISHHQAWAYFSG